MLRAALLATAATLSDPTSLPAIYAQETPPPEEPKVAPASAEAEQAISGFQFPSDWKASVFAAEPLVANPVAFHIDDRGRVFVCESFRQEQGIEDNRKHGYWLEDDQAAQTVADRLAYMKKHLGEKVLAYQKQDDRIRLLVDRDGDGKADDARVFANGFNQIEAGTGAGVVTLGEDVFYTCIPDLWRLRDRDGDGKSDERQSLQTGYGVRFAFRGHDLHGLVVGPDGKLYFSIGDRGYNITTEGRRWVNPESGAVFRCNPDGSQFEVVAYGLRNPQELAFDDLGNLFTCDNNSDSGDQARWTVIAEGGDTGWRMSYQYLPDRGPFNREKIWQPFSSETPAYVVPPIANLSSGPSGLAYYPGTGLGEHYRGRFFLCDFRGAAGGSVIRTFRVEPAGAFFKVTDAEETVKRMLATDIEFGPDGAVYVSDWVDGWTGLGKGRLYRFVSSTHGADPVVGEVRTILASDLKKRSPEELATLLGHVDRRARQRAQFALVELQASDALSAAAARTATPLLARLHALWGLGQLAGRAPSFAETTRATIRLLYDDAESEVRAAALRLAGDLQVPDAARLIRALRDDSARVRYFAAQSLGKLQAHDAVEPLVGLLADNRDEDPMLRHAASVALARIAGWELGTPVEGLSAAQQAQRESAIKHLAAAGKHPSPAARRGVILALRKLQSDALAGFLADADASLVLEAARAIYDERVTAAYPELARLLARPGLADPIVRRALQAHYRLGTAENAAAIATFATRVDADEARRLEALQLLENWASPPTRDGVLNQYQPLAPRDAHLGREAFQAVLPRLLVRQDKVGLAAVSLAARQGLKEVGPVLRKLIEQPEAPAATRADALRALAAIDADGAREWIAASLEDKQPAVRSAARELLARSAPEKASTALALALAAGELSERQSAARVLGTLDLPEAGTALAQALESIESGEFPVAARLDVLEAAALRKEPAVKTALERLLAARRRDEGLSAYVDCVEGGDAAAGEQIFYERTQVSCVRCHKAAGRGGDVGPDLSKIGAEKTRAYLLESIVLPNKAIAKNFESVLLVTDDGRTHSGIVKAEDAESLQLMTVEGKLVKFDKESIEERRESKSAMPEDLIKQLTPRDVRDLVEFLATRKGE